MSRIRHRGHKTHHSAHHASGGEAKVGNPNVFRLAEGHSVGHVHGEKGKSHLGLAKGGKVKAHKRASGGGADTHPFSSAKLAHGGHAGHHKGGKHHEMHSSHEGHPSGLHHGHHAEHDLKHKGHHRGRHHA